MLSSDTIPPTEIGPGPEKEVCRSTVRRTCSHVTPGGALATAGSPVEGHVWGLDGGPLPQKDLLVS